MQIPLGPSRPLFLARRGVIAAVSGLARFARFALVAAIVIAVDARSAHAQALHCGRTIVLPGDAQADVLRKCGAPTRRQSASAKGQATAAPSRATSHGKRSGAARGGKGRELWIYDLGSRQLVRVLTFERGRLTGIDFAGYGGR